MQEIIITDIQREGISLPKVLTESGLSPVKPGVANALMYAKFAALWNSLYRKPYRWEDNPEVWVLEFELAKTG